MEDPENAILSSDEVESLLESFHESQGITAQPDIIEEADSKIKYYDFKRPNTISREKKRMLYKVFETTAYQISREVSNFLRGTVKVSLNSIDELSFEIFKNTCPELMFINTIRLKPLKGFGCIAMDMGLSLSIVEKAFGGEGKTQNEIRKLTDTETAIVSNVVKIVLEKIANSWKPYDEMEWNVSDTAMEPRYLNIASEADVVLLVSFTFNLESSFGEMKFCVPVSSVDYTLDHFFSNKQSTSIETDNESAGALKKISRGIKLSVSGILDETDFTVNDIVNLKSGDVLRLDSKITNNLKVFIEGKNKFHGKLGIYASKKAIQIVGISGDDCD